MIRRVCGFHKASNTREIWIRSAFLWETFPISCHKHNWRTNEEIYLQYIKIFCLVKKHFIEELDFGRWVYMAAISYSSLISAFPKSYTFKKKFPTRQRIPITVQHSTFYPLCTHQGVHLLCSLLLYFVFAFEPHYYRTRFGVPVICLVLPFHYFSPLFFFFFCHCNVWLKFQQSLTVACNMQAGLKLLWQCKQQKNAKLACENVRLPLLTHAFIHPLHVTHTQWHANA